MHVYTRISYTCFSLNIHFKVTVNGHSTALILVWFINCLFFPVLKRGWTLCRSLKAVSVCTAGLIRTYLFVFIQCLEAEVCIIVNDATLPSVGQNLQAHCPVGLLTWHYIVILIKTSVCSRPDKLLMCICKCPVSSLPPFGDFKNKSWGNLQKRAHKRELLVQYFSLTWSDPLRSCKVGRPPRTLTWVISNTNCILWRLFTGSLSAWNSLQFA